MPQQSLVNGDKPRVLVVASLASYRTHAYLAAARALNVEAIVAAPGSQALAGAGIVVDPHDMEAAARLIVEQAARTRIDAVVATDDSTVELAARVAELLGLRHNPPAAARLARRKDLARACLAVAGVPIPRFARIDLALLHAPQARAVGFPCVLKPLAMSASRGVIRADNDEQFARAATRIASIVRDEPEQEAQRFLLAEEFIPGVEIALEGLLSDGDLQVLAVFDKPDPLDGPFFEETCYVTPSRLDAATQERVREVVQAACRAYGLREGPVHAELRLNEKGPWLLEVAARTIGGQCARLLRFGAGYGLEELVLRHALGERIVPRATEGAAGVFMIPTPGAGILRRVEGVLAAERVPFIEEVRIEVHEGNELVPLPEGDAYLGFLFARAPAPEQVEQALRAAHACLNVVIAPMWKVAVVPPTELPYPA